MCFKLPSSGCGVKNIVLFMGKIIKNKAGTHADRSFRSLAISSLKRTNKKKQGSLVWSFVAV